MKKLVVLFVLTFMLPCIGFTQDINKNLRKHLGYLASDKLHGRLTGTKYEKMAADYIIDQFIEIRLKPFPLHATNVSNDREAWLEGFDFNLALKYGPNNSISIASDDHLNGKKLELDKDFYPVPYSEEGSISASVIDVGFGIKDDKVGLNSYQGLSNLEGKIFLINLSLPDGDVHKYGESDGWRARYEMAKLYKPAAILFYNSKEPINLEAFKMFNSIQREKVFMLHITSSWADQIKKAKNIVLNLNVNLEAQKGIGHNVLGYINNNKSETIVIGAHYDHLGEGEAGNSLYRGKPAIHNGADDNASGTAALIELARIIKKSGPSNHNYLFIAFSGEELGLVGSKSFTANPEYIKNIDYMLNMDMVGRLDSMKLALSGTGTSPTWDSIIMKVMPGTFKIKTSASGIGPSDHASFYLKGIPVLHFFTGSHADYHKPSDDIDKINFNGMVDIVNYLDGIVNTLDSHPRLVFQKTKDDTASTRVKYKVTLGVIPDYMYDKGGMRIDGVSSGKPAERAGLQAGDVVIKLGDHEVKDMGGYMSALSKFHKGDTTEVTIIRNGKELKKQVSF